MGDGTLAPIGVGPFKRLPSLLPQRVPGSSHGMPSVRDLADEVATLQQELTVCGGQTRAIALGYALRWTTNDCSEEDLYAIAERFATWIDSDGSR